MARRSRAPSPRRHPPSRKKPRHRERETAGPCPAAYPVVRAGRWKMTRAPIGGVLRSMTATPWRALAPVRRDDGHLGGKRKEGLRGRPHPPLRYAPHTFCLLHPLSKRKISGELFLTHRKLKTYTTRGTAISIVTVPSSCFAGAHLTTPTALLSHALAPPPARARCLSAREREIGVSPLKKGLVLRKRHHALQIRDSATRREVPLERGELNGIACTLHIPDGPGRVVNSG